MPPQQPHMVPSVHAPYPASKDVLPNGVRLRLALTTVINDLFSRQPLAFRQFRAQAAAAASSSPFKSDSSASASRETARSSSSSMPSSSHLSRLPQSLVPLLSVSSAVDSVPASSPPHLVCVRSLCSHHFARCPYKKDTNPLHREPVIKFDSPDHPKAISCGAQIARARHIRSWR